MNAIGSNSFNTKEVLAQLKDMQSQLKHGMDSKTPDTGEGKSFLDHLKEGVSEVNKMNVTSDKMAMDLASGKAQNIHETMLAATQSELSFNLMVQIRNKILEAYQEVMRMQV